MAERCAAASWRKWRQALLHWERHFPHVKLLYVPLRCPPLCHLRARHPPGWHVAMAWQREGALYGPTLASCSSMQFIQKGFGSDYGPVLAVELKSGAATSHCLPVSVRTSRVEPSELWPARQPALPPALSLYCSFEASLMLML